ncbi:MAG: hypothetical protein KTR31_33225 [Myxococcales bacterium]|nr:hypothetical protein [Myxococcales bacterium]
MRLDPAQLRNPDTDLRYALPKALEHWSGGAVRSDGYDYDGPDGTAAMLIYVRVDDVDTGLAFVTKFLRDQRVMGNDLQSVTVRAVAE